MGYDGWGSSRVPPPAKGSSVERQAAEGAKAQRQDDRSMRANPREVLSVSGDYFTSITEDLTGVDTLLGPVAAVPPGRTGTWLVIARAWVRGGTGGSTGYLDVASGGALGQGDTARTETTVADGVPGAWTKAVYLIDIAPSSAQADCSWVGDPIAEIHLTVTSKRIP